MSYEELAKAIHAGYNKLKKNEIDKLYYVTWNSALETSEITVENDAGFRAIIIGNTDGMSKSRGFMYLFYTNDRSVPFPTIEEIACRLKMVVNKEIITSEDADYNDWKEYGSLEEQREYFSEIVLNALNKSKNL